MRGRKRNESPPVYYTPDTPSNTVGIGRSRKKFRQRALLWGVIALFFGALGLVSSHFSSPSLSVPTVYAAGDRGEGVLAVEEALDALGYDVGTPDSIYTVVTGRAVARFQQDMGMRADGVCSVAVRDALLLATGVTPRVSEDALCTALARAGCYTGLTDDPDALRNGLILFQRSHGLRGTGQAGFATLRALGFDVAPLYTHIGMGGQRAKETEADLRLALVCGRLRALALEQGEEADLRLLTCAAAVLLNRERASAENPLFPDSFSLICRMGWQGDGASVPLRTAPLSETTEERILRAAEDALRGTDPTHGALYLAPMEDFTLPAGRYVTLSRQGYVFYR